MCAVEVDDLADSEAMGFGEQLWTVFILDSVISFKIKKYRISKIKGRIKRYFSQFKYRKFLTD